MPMPMRVPLVDLTAQFRSIRGEVMDAIEAVLESGQFFLGPNTRAFEAEYAAYCGTAFSVAVENGTDALYLALRAAGIGPGDEVITVSHTFIATVEAIHQVGAHAVLIDVDPNTYTMSPAALEERISSRTRAVIPVHLYGRLADMDRIMSIAGRCGALVIEDASQAHGAVDAHGRHAGSIGDLGCFSFYYAKNLGAYGEAGAVTTSNGAYDRELRLLRSHGEATRYHHDVLGINSRPDEIQSAVLRIKLRHLNDWTRLRLEHASGYDARLRDLQVTRPELDLDGSHVYHQYVIRTTRRDLVRDRLTERGIGTGTHYPIPIHQQPAWRRLGQPDQRLPVTEQVSQEILSLPMYPELTDEQLDLVVTELAAALQEEPVGV
jgi:dTDP-4-amino-4,6-dideoxygalactose transaminase